METAQSHTEHIDLCNKLTSRFKKVLEVGIYKKQRGISPLDEARWDEVIKRITTLAKEVGIPENFIINIWNQFHDRALKLEEKIEVSEQTELNLDEIRLEINQIDNELISIIGTIYKEVGEKKTNEIILGTLNRIGEVL